MAGERLSTPPPHYDEAASKTAGERAPVDEVDASEAPAKNRRGKASQQQHNRTRGKSRRKGSQQPSQGEDPQQRLAGMEDGVGVPAELFESPDEKAAEDDAGSLPEGTSPVRESSPHPTPPELGAYLRSQRRQKLAEALRQRHQEGDMSEETVNGCYAVLRRAEAWEKEWDIVLPETLSGFVEWEADRDRQNGIDVSAYAEQAAREHAGRSVWILEGNEPVQATINTQHENHLVLTVNGAEARYPLASAQELNPWLLSSEGAAVPGTAAEAESLDPEIAEREDWARSFIDEHVRLSDLEYDQYGNENRLEVGETAKALIDARERLAEARVGLRTGTLSYSRSRREKTLENAKTAYWETRKVFIKETLEQSQGDREQKHLLAVMLNAREDGAMMGEEANHYLSVHNSKFRRFAEWYGNLSKPKQIALGVGAAALSGVAFGAVGGAAAAGGIFGSRIGRGYLSREARRQHSGLSKEDRIKQLQKEATLLGASHEDYQTLRDKPLSKSKRKGGQPFKHSDKTIASETLAQSSGLQDRWEEDYAKAADRAEEEKRRKRRTAGGALIGAALGSGIGVAADQVVGWEGLAHREGGDSAPSGNAEELSEDLSAAEEQIAEQEQQITGLEDQVSELEEQQAAEEQATEPAGAEQISERSQHLYGELAGGEVDITVPEGGNVWNQLETTVEQEMPGISEGEKQRLVGNVLNQLEQEYPGRDLNLVQPGEHFSVSLPS